MITAEKLEKHSTDVAAILGAMMDAQIDYEHCCDPLLDRDHYSRRLVDDLHKIEDELLQLCGAPSSASNPEIRNVFARANQQPIKVGSRWFASIHHAIEDLAGEIYIIAGDVLESAFPGTFPPGVNTLCPNCLPCKSDLLSHIETVLRSFGTLGFPSLDKLNELSARREIELAKALAELPPDTALTPDEQRQKFCFEEWQSGKTYKEINTALKHHSEWESFEDEKSVRGPIEKWGKRVGVAPRSGQRGRLSAG